MQERHNSSALAVELRLSCTNPSISTLIHWGQRKMADILRMTFSIHFCPLQTPFGHVPLNPSCVLRDIDLPPAGDLHSLMPCLENDWVNSLACGRSECDSKNIMFNLVLMTGFFRSSHDNNTPRGQSSVVGGLKWWLSRGCKRPFHRQAQIWVKQYLA